MLRRDDIMHLLLVAIIGYLFGCLNGAQIIGKMKHINMKTNGSGNAGATNTTVLLGWKSGALVAFIDVFKAILSLYITAAILMEMNLFLEYEILLLYLNALFVVVGHNFPMTMQFKGGKGTASFLGILLFIDWKFAILAFMVFIIFAFATNYFVIGTFMAYISFIGYTSSTYGRAPTYVALLFTFLFLCKHTDNMKRIMNKEEMKLTSLFRRHAS